MFFNFCDISELMLLLLLRLLDDGGGGCAADGAAAGAVVGRTTTGGAATATTAGWATSGGGTGGATATATSESDSPDEESPSPPMSIASISSPPMVDYCTVVFVNWVVCWYVCLLYTNSRGLANSVNINHILWVCRFKPKRDFSSHVTTISTLDSPRPIS